MYYYVTEMSHIFPVSHSLQLSEKKNVELLKESLEIVSHITYNFLMHTFLYLKLSYKMCKSCDVIKW